MPTSARPAAIPAAVRRPHNPVGAECRSAPTRLRVPPASGKPAAQPGAYAMRPYIAGANHTSLVQAIHYNDLESDTMYELITQETLAEYEAFVQSHPKGNFAQSYLWGKQKPMWVWKAIAVRGDDGKIKGSLAVMIRKMPIVGRTPMYGCRGPVCDLDDRDTFGQLLAGAKALAKEYKSYVIKIDPDVPSSNTGFYNLLRSFGFESKEGGKNFEAIQPRYVFRLNVEGK